MRLLICLDGCDPAYLAAAPTPNLDAMAGDGFYKEVLSVVPSVTNVNNVSMVTGSFPSAHGITSNFLRHSDGTETYMESQDFVLCPTILEKARANGLKTAAITSKLKLLNIIGRGADVAVSAEKPTAYFVAMVGEPFPVFSMEINVWAFDAAHFILREQRPDLLYLSTTDYIMHTYAPEDEPAQLHLRKLDEVLGRMLNEFPKLKVTVTADHGMNQKSTGIDLEKVLRREGIHAKAIPIIKDKYIQHHFNQGGAAYVHVETGAPIEAAEVLRQTEGIDEVCSRTEAAGKYRLRQERIGDLFVLGDRDTVFGTYKEPRRAVNVRSHGSCHERKVPLITNDTEKSPENYLYNVDAGANWSEYRTTI